MLEEIKRSLRTADHMLYVTYPVIKESRLLIKAFEEIHSVVSKLIELILKHEYHYKRVQLYSNPNLNLTVFEQRCAERYKLTEEDIVGIKQIIDIYQSHKSSPVEFVRQNKFVIMSDNLKTESITLPKLKTMLSAAKNLVKRTEITISSENLQK
jgi:hypothetical protein